MTMGSSFTYPGGGGGGGQDKGAKEPGGWPDDEGTGYVYRYDCSGTAGEAVEEEGLFEGEREEGWNAGRSRGSFGLAFGLERAARA